MRAERHINIMSYILCITLIKMNAEVIYDAVLTAENLKLIKKM
jgi:hypothetical protein